jgi:hypothetical protein
MVGSFDASYGYLSKYKLSDRKVAVCIGFYHFAHHLWNELPGIDRLVKKGMIDSVDKFLVLREPLGDLRQIFPEIPASKVSEKPPLMRYLKIPGEVARESAMMSPSIPI